MLALDAELDPAAAARSANALRAISETAVAMRVWSWRVEAEQLGDLARALAREHDVVLVARCSSVRSGGLIAASRSDDHGRVVAAAAVVAVEHAGDERGMALREARDSASSFQCDAEPVGVQHEQRRPRGHG